METAVFDEQEADTLLRAERDESPAQELAVFPALPHQRTEALAALYSRLSSRRRELLFRWAGRLHKKSPHAFRHLVVAMRADQIRGVIWGLPCPGRQIHVIPPVLLPGEPESTSHQLVSTLDKLLYEDPFTRIGLAVFDHQADGWKGVARSGYHYVTDIARMAFNLADHSPCTIEGPLIFEPFLFRDPLRLKALLYRANAGSLDCPRMHGLRPIDDIFCSHFNRDGYTPSAWQIVRHGQHDIGCILVSHNVHQNQCELVYMGLVAEARRKGYGRSLIQKAISLAHSTGASRLTLGCDVHNPPAYLTYERAGFQETERISLHVKAYRRLHSPEAASQLDELGRKCQLRGLTA